MTFVKYSKRINNRDFDFENEFEGDYQIAKPMQFVIIFHNFQSNQNLIVSMVLYL